MCGFSELPWLILSNCQNPVKAETLALTGFWQFDLGIKQLNGNFQTIKIHTLFDITYMFKKTALYARYITQCCFFEQ